MTRTGTVMAITRRMLASASRSWTLLPIRQALTITPLVVLLGTVVACGGGGGSDPRCVARSSLRDAVGAVGQADAAEVAGDARTAAERMAEVERLVATARRNLSASTTSTVERAMVEAAGYLQFIVDEHRASGMVDAPLAQFATRELNRAPAPGEPPLDC